MLENFTLPEPEDDYDRKLLSDLETHGWSAIAIDPDDEGPPYVFTVGFYYSYGHPEVVIMGMEHQVAHQFLQVMALEIQEGKRYEDGHADTELASLPMAFRSVALEHYRGYLGYCLWFYQNLPDPFPTVQLVWPDRAGKFPWDDGYEEQFFALQKRLYN